MKKTFTKFMNKKIRVLNHSQKFVIMKKIFIEVMN